MKKLFIAAIAVFNLASTYAQTNTFPTTGNVGIGTTGPVNALTILGSNGGSSPGYTATFSSNLGSINTVGNQVNITNLHSNWGLLLGFDGPTISPFGYHGRNAAYVVNVANAPLYIGSNNAANMTIAPDGNVGIGLTSPNMPLQIAKAGTNVTGDMTLLSTFTDPTGIKGISLGYNEHSQAGIIYSENNTGVGSPLEFWTYNGGTFASRMVFTQNGNLGIGTASPDQKLTVNGTIHTKEVKVDMNGWPDYVFKQSYSLASLKSVKTYIDHNHHLPDFPSERSVAIEGINLGEMNKRLVKKVEELTLYLIEKDGQLKQQQAQLKSQQKQIDQILKSLKK